MSFPVTQVPNRHDTSSIIVRGRLAVSVSVVVLVVDDEGSVEGSVEGSGVGSTDVSVIGLVVSGAPVVGELVVDVLTPVSVVLDGPDGTFVVDGSVAVALVVVPPPLSPQPAITPRTRSRAASRQVMVGVRLTP